MKPEKIVIVTAGSLSAAGLATWVIGGAPLMRAVGSWLCLAGFGVASIPLLLTIVCRIIEALRRSGSAGIARSTTVLAVGWMDWGSGPFLPLERAGEREAGEREAAATG